MQTVTAELVLDAQADLGEGPVWHAGEQQLYWVDITRGDLHAFDPATGRDAVHRIGQSIGFAVPRAAGGFILGLQHGLFAFEPRTGALTPIADPESQSTGNRFNDGKCDPAGRLYAGTIGKPGSGALWRLDSDRSLHRVVPAVTCSNGLAWSADRKTFYYTDTPTRQIDAFDYDPETGRLAHRRTVVRVPAEAGSPDGMAIDAEDKLWVGHWDGGQVVRWDPQTGRALARIAVPAARATSCAFGGKHLDTLYITTARVGLDANALGPTPHAGGLFVAQPGVSGAPVGTFGG